MILRTYACPECAHQMTVELRSDQWNTAPPHCPNCIVTGANTDNTMQQEFFPPAIGGSNRSRAEKLAFDIAEKDYGVADLQTARGQGDVTKVRYRDAAPGASSWGAPNAAMAQAMALGRENRLKYGSGLDALQSALKSGAQPDLIEASKKKSARGW